MQRLGQAIYQFLQEEEILQSQSSIHNNSSDIIESIFGMYKRRKSPNKLYGVTSFILFIPAYAKLSSKKYTKGPLIKEHLENVKLNQIQEWESAHLTENLVRKRIKTLKRAG